MGIVKADITVSADGYLSGPDQSLEDPFGRGGLRLFEWEDDQANSPGFQEGPTGAFVMGRNMFGPVRGQWDLSWTGWDDEPPYHAPVYVLTHHPRDPVTMKGGTTFHFVTAGIESALERAREAAGDLDVQIAGGANTLRQYLAAGLLDELVLHLAPFTLGDGERLLDGLGALTFDQVESSSSPAVTHLKYRVRR
ncbi:dihydrofolate reductase family protein [Jiangella muralis]|uniref:dihydrofolate reductase family protein n=1 Tax=Jiangella muralis TaxID=702383 RepID=UPI00069DBD56|nr:dihydrofolate reductase family protein [Jiangella muralis]